MTRRITSLKLQKNNNQRVNVYLDGEYAFGLTRIVAAWLEIGTQLSEEKITELVADDRRETAYQRALNLINYRPRTEVEIRQKLRRHQIDEDNIQYVLDRLRHSGLVNDVEFAQTWVDNRSEIRPRSRRALAYELKQRGINSETIEQTLERVDDSAMAYAAAQKQAPKINNLEWREFRQKMLRYLTQRGFSYDNSSEAASRVWDEMHSTEQYLTKG
jgi:regulatory protein